MADALTSKLARRWAVDVKPQGSDEEYKRVRGINSFQPALNPNFEDTTDYDNDGWSSEEKTLQGWSLDLTFIEKHRADEDSTQDPGQEVLENASDKFGDASKVDVRWYEREGEKAYEGVASVNFQPQGGSPTDLSSVNVTLQGNGPRRRITKPAEGDAGSGE